MVNAFSLSTWQEESGRAEFELSQGYLVSETLPQKINQTNK